VQLANPDTSLNLVILSPPHHVVCFARAIENDVASKMPSLKGSTFYQKLRNFAALYNKEEELSGTGSDLGSTDTQVQDQVEAFCLQKKINGKQRQIYAGLMKIDVSAGEAVVLSQMLSLFACFGQL